jgi:hypothetical protein
MNKILVIGLALSLSGCFGGHPQVPSDRIVVEKVPVATQPITKDQIPLLPGQLGKRPPDARQAADQALAGRCDAIAFVIRAYPLLLLSAGLPPAQVPDYPECRNH